MSAIDHISIRDRLVRRYYDRPGSIEQIAAEEFPEANPEDIHAASRQVAHQCLNHWPSRDLVLGREELQGAAEWNHKVLSPCCRRESRRIGFRIRVCRKCKRTYEILEGV